MITDSFSSEKERANSAEIKRMQSGDVNFRENSATSALRARLDMDGLSTEKTQLLKQVSLIRYLIFNENSYYQIIIIDN